MAARTTTGSRRGGGNDETDGEEGEDKTFAGSGNDVLRDQTRSDDYDDSLIDAGGGDDVIAPEATAATGLNHYIHKVVGGPGDDEVYTTTWTSSWAAPAVTSRTRTQNRSSPDSMSHAAASGNDSLGERKLMAGPATIHLCPLGWTNPRISTGGRVTTS